MVFFLSNPPYPPPSPLKFIWAKQTPTIFLTPGLHTPPTDGKNFPTSQAATNRCFISGIRPCFISWHTLVKAIGDISRKLAGRSSGPCTFRLLSDSLSGNITSINAPCLPCTISQCQILGRNAFPWLLIPIQSVDCLRYHVFATLKGDCFVTYFTHKVSGKTARVMVEEFIGVAINFSSFQFAIDVDQSIKE